GVRESALRMLLSRFPSNPAASYALETARRDESPAVRLAAAAALPFEDDRAMTFSSLLSFDVPMAIRVKALALAETTLSRYVAAPLLLQGLAAPEPQVRAQAIWGLGRIRHREGLDAL